MSADSLELACGSMPTPRSIQRTYLTLMLGNTLAASFIWGINTIFLLDAGLSTSRPSRPTPSSPPAW